MIARSLFEANGGPASGADAIPEKFPGAWVGTWLKRDRQTPFSGSRPIVVTRLKTPTTACRGAGLSTPERKFSYWTARPALAGAAKSPPPRPGPSSKRFGAYKQSAGPISANGNRKLRSRGHEATPCFKQRATGEPHGRTLGPLFAKHRASLPGFQDRNPGREETCKREYPRWNRAPWRGNAGNLGRAGMAWTCKRGPSAGAYTLPALHSRPDIGGEPMAEANKQSLQGTLVFCSLVFWRFVLVFFSGFLPSFEFRKFCGGLPLAYFCLRALTSRRPGGRSFAPPGGRATNFSKRPFPLRFMGIGSW